MAAEGPGSKATKANVNLSTADFALEHYVAVTTAGESAGVEQLFAEDFNQKIQSSNVQSHNRSEVVKLLKKQKGEKLNCTVSTDILEESADFMVAKVTLKFENFTKTDLLTLEHVGNDWKVSKSINSYKISAILNKYILNIYVVKPRHKMWLFYDLFNSELSRG